MCKLEVVESNLINTALNKPKYLSAPGHYNTPKYLDYLVNKEEKDLNGVDYRVLLNTNLLAGTFNETVYYLPLAVSYICSDAEDRGEMIVELIDYIFINHDQIESLFNIKIGDILNYIFQYYTLKFNLIYMDKEDCKDKGWGIDGYVYVENSELVCSLFKTSILYPKGIDWVKCKVSELKTGTEIQRKWLYTLYEECNEIFGQYLDDETMIEVLDSLPEND